jgi:uncharacterized protein (DUF488 family)
VIAPVRVHTVGHSTRTESQFLEVLEAHGIRHLIDVRAFPASRRHPWFHRAALETSLAERGIEYRWEGADLGGRRRAPPDSPHHALRVEGFRAYASHMETAEFRRGVARVLESASREPTAILCAEALWWRCHRSMIADHLAAIEGAEVVHVLDATRTEPHRLHRTARTHDGGLVYDVTARP